MTKRSYTEWVETLPLLKEKTHYRLKNGMIIFVCPTLEKWPDDHVIIQGRQGDGRTASVHVYAPDIEGDDDLGVLFYDNLKVGMKGYAKRNPTYTIDSEEFPIQVRLLQSENKIKVIENEWSIPRGLHRKVRKNGN